MVSRRNFLSLLLSGSAAFIFSKCFSNSKKNNIRIFFKESSSVRGHEVWKKKIVFSEIKKYTKDLVIIGGGISGLSAAHNFIKNGITNITVLELADKPGGNSISGINTSSEYPYGAHYLTLPNPENKPLISFLHEKGIIQDFDALGKPIYNETDLCLDPEERLFMRGGFQEGLIPNYGLSIDDKKETERFFKLIDEFKVMIGNDGKYFFNIPFSFCSEDPKLNYLDELSFEDFLIQKEFKNNYLTWYLNYCCRDDFGGGINKVSAWSGINYFAGHRADPSNTDPSRVLTWPEGNGKLVKLLTKNIQGVIETACLVKYVELIGDKVKIEGIDFKNKTQFEIICNSCILAIPPFVASKILDKKLPYPFESAIKLKHTPWMVATVTLKSIPEARGTGICWDNVAFGTKSLGYIYDQHQNLNQQSDKCVLSLYLPIDDTDDRTSRKLIEQRSLSEWQEIVIQELEIMHSEISNLIEEIEICIWGHGMIMPTKGLIKSGILKQLSKPIENKIFFAHTDLSAYSTFEEGFDIGFRCSETIKAKNS